jgi:hypothetical protein
MPFRLFLNTWILCFFALMVHGWAKSDINVSSGTIFVFVEAMWRELYIG